MVRGVAGGRKALEPEHAVARDVDVLLGDGGELAPEVVEVREEAARARLEAARVDEMGRADRRDVHLRSGCSRTSVPAAPAWSRWMWRAGDGGRPGARGRAREPGHELQDVRHLLLSHIHLDHAGAAGTLVREHPDLQVHVSEIGAPHVVDPSRLEASARRLFPDFDNLWGELAAVPEENVHVAGARVLGLECFPSPGHASHHVCYLHEDGTLYAGDAAGVRVVPGRHVLPVSPPPDVDVEGWFRTFEEIERRRPERLALIHFGVVDSPSEHLLIAREELAKWSERCERDRRGGVDRGRPARPHRRCRRRRGRAVGQGRPVLAVLRRDEAVLGQAPGSGGLGDRERLLVPRVAVTGAELLLERPLEVTRLLQLLDDIGAPINSPLTNTCGIVGQPDWAESSWRIAGSGRMSTAVTGAPARRNASSARRELPHIAICGVPFMKSATCSPSITSLIFPLSSLMPFLSF